MKILQKIFCFAAIGGKIGRDNVHVIAGSDGFFLLVNLHFVKVCDFSFYGFDCLRLIDAFDMQVYDHSRFQIQKVRQDAVV